MAGAGPGCICVDGRMLAPHEATVSALDAGLLLGDGLFESLRVSGCAPYLLDRHLERLYAGATEVSFERMPAREQLASQVYATLERAGLEDAYLRVTVTRGRGGGPPSALPSGSPTVVIAALPAPPPLDPSAGIGVALIEPSPRLGPRAKSTSRQSAVLAKRAVERAGATEGIYVSDLGRVLEGTSSNVFVVSDGRLLTPPAEDCLPGITRGRVLELARQDGVSALEVPLTVAQLLGAQEAFLSNAVQGLFEIGTIDGRPLLTTQKGGAFGSKGGVFERLLALYEGDRSRATKIPAENHSNCE